MSPIKPKVYFWAKVTFEEGKSLAPNGRPDFFYPDNHRQGYLIWPIDRTSNEWSFCVLDPEFWEKVHVHRIIPGCEFELWAGQLIAKGIVTKVEGN
jgi:hypothetical protein